MGIDGSSPGTAVENQILSRSDRRHGHVRVKAREGQEGAPSNVLAGVFIRLAHVHQHRLTALQPLLHLGGRGLLRGSAAQLVAG